MSSLRLISFTKQIATLINQSRHEQALSLFHHIHSTLALSLDPFVFSLVLKSCAALRRPQLGAVIHSHTIKSCFLPNPFVACALVHMYGKCVSLCSARNVFDEIPHRNVVVWSSMISLYMCSNRVSDALRVFYAMDVEANVDTFNSVITGFSRVEGGSFKAILFFRKMVELGLKPDLMTLLAMLRACVGMAGFNLIKEIHGYSVRSNIDPNSQLRSGLVEAYGRCGCLDYARYLFQSMKEKDVVAWSSLISAYALHGEARIALGVFHEMEAAKVRPDDITFLAVLKACSHAGLADEGLGYFWRMQKVYGLEAGCDHYSCLVDILSRAGRLHQAYEILRDMPVKGTVQAWGALLSACLTHGELQLAETAGKALSEIEPGNPATYLILTRMYASLGRHEEAERMRREMREKGVKADPGSSWVMQS